ncbi:Tat pathway signal protein [Arthrobacter sp. NPDC090010]|uniref:Tat pathway signal protein n=1 Tax=Arthrobacter sp. NPDC090010 TaxID=3363942 RepID=UPI0037F8A0A3
MSQQDDASASRPSTGGDPGQVPESGSGRRAEGSSAVPPWQPTAPALDPTLVDQGAQAVAGNADPQAPHVDPFAQEEAAQQVQHKKRTRRRTLVISLGVTALLAGTITAVVSSQNDDEDYAQVCTDESTQQRVDDANCDDSGASSAAGRGHAHYGWYFFPRGSVIPAVGSSVKSYSGGTSTLPKGSTAAKGFSSKGGSFTKSTTTRGGFGKSSGGKSYGG